MSWNIVTTKTLKSLSANSRLDPAGVDFFGLSLFLSVGCIFLFFTR